ncbi:uncharacterized protein UTRI_03431_B [Ustilago trichophora]|uniref:Transmembrane protein n=1 Tax=Ustilago trichophora TaxID=86804 RepID=A0A5C3E341_9BASI|nr:uncharacterized protein UTRI_03431_B [Ustilago trichophora]
MSAGHTSANMLGIIEVPHHHNHPSFNVHHFPLADNATVNEVLMLVDSLALKTLPRGYWQLSWATSSLNLTIFFLIAIAMRSYRSRKTPVPLWLFKLESRPYRVKRTNKSSKTTNERSSSMGIGASLDRDRDCSSTSPPSEHRHGFKARLGSLFNCSPSTAARVSDEKPQSTSEEEQGGEEIRMGKFITASCVNCHLVLTSAYVVLLFLKVAEAYTTREASSAPPLLSPGILEAFMTAAIFSTAYFAALGYIAILLPNVPPWMWNSSVITNYVATMTIGLFTISKIALSASYINGYRQLVWFELVYLPSLVHPVATESLARERPAGEVAMKLARVAYQEALRQRIWLQCSHGLIALGGITLAIIYLVILVTLSRKVAMELNQIRNAPLPPSSPQVGMVSAVSVEDKKSEAVSTSAVTMWPLTAVPFSLPSGSQTTDPVLKTFLSQPARFSLPLRTGAARTPPPTPAPNGPLPLPPVERVTDSRSSTPDSAAYSVAEVRTELPLNNSSTAERRSSVTLQQQPPTSLPNGQQDRKTTSADSKLSFPAHHDDEDDERPSSPTSSSTHRTRLDLGPRTRVDSQPIPWAVNALHEDLATSEGYVAVCKFLFNCIIDHAAVMLQCFAFGSTSIYLTVVYSKTYPNDAQSASLQVGRINMVFSCLFTLLYLINSVNLFAPFLLFPTSQVKLATMLASLYTPNSNSNSNSDSGKYRERGRYPRRSASKRMLRNKRKKAAEKESETPRSELRPQESSRELLAAAGKVTSEMYSSKNAASATSLPWSPGGTLCGDAMQYPPTSSTTTASSPSEDRDQKGRRNKSMEKEGAIRSRITGPIVTAIRLFRTPPPEDVGSNGFTPLRREMTLASPATQLSTLGLSPSPTGFRALLKFSPFSPPFSSPSSRAKADDGNSKQRNFSNISTSPSVHNSLPSSNVAGSGSESCYVTCESSPPHISASAQQQGKQLVLDSLISSHALPIQGFYCHRPSALGLSASGSGGGLRLYHPNESVESGFGWSGYDQDEEDQQHVLRPRPKPRVRAKRRFDDAPPVRPSRRSQPPLQPHPYEVDTEFDEEDQAQAEMREYETEEELQHSDPQGGSMGMGEASKRRRQRLRQQFRGQIGAHGEFIPLQQQQRSSSSSDHELVQVVVRRASLPTIAQLQQYPTPSTTTRGGLDETADGLLRLPGAELRSEARTILARDNGVPSIVAQPPTPISSSRPRAMTQPQLEEEYMQKKEKEMDSVQHRTMISIPIRFDRSAAGADVMPDGAEALDADGGVSVDSGTFGDS